MANISIGKYVAYNDFVHRIDPRVKIFGAIILMVCVFIPVPSITLTFTLLGVLFLVNLVLLICSHISPLTFVKTFTSFWIAMIFLFLIYILIPRNNPIFQIAWNLNGWIVYYDAFVDAGKVLLRLFLMLELSLILTSTTKPLDLTYAFEWYLTPFKYIGLPTAEIAMTLSIALRFIPTLLEDSDRVMKSQASRGVDFDHGAIWKKVRGITSLIIPLFVSSFMRSEELANAMECRGYDPRAKRTRYRVLKIKIGDVFAVFLIAAILAGFIYISVTGWNFYLYFFKEVI